MTKEQAIQAMEQGKKVTHRYFSPDEFITIKDGKILTEEGYSCTHQIFWSGRRLEQWNDGWEEFADKKYPIGFYAPGNYFCTCAQCGNQFRGDKRAMECEPCAIAAKEEFDKMSPKEQEELVKENFEIFKELYNKIVKKQ